MRSCTLILLVQVAVPPLPVIAVDAFPTWARDTISRVYREAIAAPDDVERVAVLARTLHAWEQWETAHQVYERLRRLEPKTFEWPYLDGVVLQRVARHAEAADALSTALTIRSEYLPARVRHAEALLEAGRLDEGRPLFEALAKQPAAEPVAEYALGRIDAARGRHADAIPHLERAVSLFPEFGAAHYALARSYRAAGRADAAARAIAAHQQHGAAWPAIADEVLAAVSGLKHDPRAEVRRGMKLAEAGDIDGAIAALEAALAGDPSLTDAHASLISLYGRAGNWAKGEAHYRQAVSLGVNLADAHYDYGVLLGLQEKWGEAAAAYRQAIAANPHHAHARNNLGQLLEGERRIDEAIAEYRAALDAQPGFRLARFNLGRMLIASGRPEDAVTELQQLTEPRDAEAARYLFALSVAHVRAGRREEGLKWAEDARQLAAAFGQRELAAAIERDLARLR